MSKPHVFWLLTVGLTFSCANLSSGTSVVLLFKKDSITVAADSRAIGIDGHRHADNCKIAVGGSDMVYAFSGYDNEPDQPFRTAALQIATENTDPTTAIEALQETLARKLMALANLLRNNSPSNFARKIEGNAIYEGAFATIEQDGPHYAEAAFVPETLPTGKISIKMIMKDCTSDCAGDLIVLGHHNGVDKFMTAHSLRSLSINPISSAKKLIEIEIRDAPEAVGPPVSVFQLRRSGVAWIDPGVCKQQDRGKDGATAK